MTFAVLLAAALFAAAAPAPAAAPAASTAAATARPHAPTMAGTELELKSVDGWTLHAVWLKAMEGKPTVILLHGTGQRKEEWRPFARALARAGDGYLAVDLRGHGESRTTPSGETINYKKLRASAKGANDYEDMTRDVEAAVAALTTQGVVEESVGLLGAEVGGSVAVKYAAVHPKVPFVIMLSPGLVTQEMPIVNAMRAFKGRATPILMVHSEADKRSARDTPLLFRFAQNSVGEGHATLMVVPEERGTRLLKANKGLTERVIAWIANPVPEAPAVSTAAAPGAAGSTTTAVAPVEGEDGAAEPESEPAPAPAPEKSGDAL